MAEGAPPRVPGVVGRQLGRVRVRLPWFEVQSSGRASFRTSAPGNGSLRGERERGWHRRGRHRNGDQRSTSGDRDDRRTLARGKLHLTWPTPLPTPTGLHSRPRPEPGWWPDSSSWDSSYSPFPCSGSTNRRGAPTPAPLRSSISPTKVLRPLRPAASHATE